MHQVGIAIPKRKNKENADNNSQTIPSLASAEIGWDSVHESQEKGRPKSVVRYLSC